MRFRRPSRTTTTTFDVPAERVAVMFCASEFADVPWPLDLRLRAFLTNPVGPINATWEDPAAYDRLVDEVLAQRLRARKASRP